MLHKWISSLLIVGLVANLAAQPQDQSDALGREMNSKPGSFIVKRVSEERLEAYRNHDFIYSGVEADYITEQKNLEIDFWIQIEKGNVRSALNQIKAYYQSKLKVEDTDLAAINYCLYLAEKMDRKGELQKAQIIGHLLADELQEELLVTINARSPQSLENVKIKERKSSLDRLEALGKVYLRLLKRPNDARLIYESLVEEGDESIHTRLSLYQLNQGQSKKAGGSQDDVSVELDQLLQRAKTVIVEKKSNE